MLELGPEFGEPAAPITLHEAGAGSLSVARETVALAVGEGAVWALERARGEVTRIDPATGDDKVLAEGFDASLARRWAAGRSGSAAERA